MKKTRAIATVAYTSLLLGSGLSLHTFADHHEGATVQASTTASMERKASDAWREGKLDTIYLFNRHLNNFTIDPEVRGNTVVLTGKVESDVDKELAEQLAKGIDGITEVTNRLLVVPSEEARANAAAGDRDFSDKVEDATLTAEVKTKLLANGQTDGLKIHVDTVARNVTLTGTVDSSAEKDLAGEITKQVDGVADVDNQLEVKS
tara:strand:+ start:212541 stop:213155 length:615 start_codon:yes stop_codon:yes gene_type:complete